LSEKIQKFREASIIACDKAHELQNSVYLFFNETDAPLIQKIDNIAGQLENQTRAINSSLYRFQKYPNELNENQVIQVGKQGKNKADVIKGHLKEIEQIIPKFTDKNISESLIPLTKMLTVFSTFSD